MKAALYLNCGRTITPKDGYDIVICADGGYNVCPLKADYLIGDGDSVCRTPENVESVKLNARKNFTDCEAAVDFAKKLGATEIHFYGVLGGRCDHVLGNFNAMALSYASGIKTVAVDDDVCVYFSDKKITLPCRKGATVSVLPHGGDVLVADYDNLEYPLVNLTLTPRDARGVSNVTTSENFTLDIVKGEALIFVYE